MLDVIAKEIKQLKILPLSSDNKTILENVILKFSLTCNPKNGKVWFIIVIKYGLNYFCCLMSFNHRYYTHRQGIIP